MRSFVLLWLLLPACSAEVDVPIPPAPPDAAAPCAPLPAKPCDDADPCTFDNPVRSRCEHVAIPDCSPCAGGSLRGSVCCKGCWAGMRCENQPDSDACGHGGEICEPCQGGQVCGQGICRAPECGTDADCAPGETCEGLVCAAPGCH